MRILSLIAVLLLLSIADIEAQNPIEFNYQSVLRDSDGIIISGETVTVDVSILKGSPGASSVFDESYSVTTDANGFIKLKIGSVEDLSVVDFSNDIYFIKISVNDIDLGVSQLLTVPYSLTSVKSDSAQFSVVLNKPITLMGYGITDAYDKTWGNLEATPTTIGGYGIIDAFVGTWSNITSTPTTIIGYGITDAFVGDWQSITNKPSSISGYGITDAFTGSWDSLSGTPTTMSGYGITDAFSGSYADLTNTPGLATDESDGFMSSEGKAKLDTLVNANLIAGNGIVVNGTSPNYTVSLSQKLHYVGELYNGGVVFWVDSLGDHGLICSMLNMSNGTSWSNITDQQIGSAAGSLWNGPLNSSSILSQPGHLISGAKLCDDYTNIDYGTGIFSDWYLPSASELLELWESLREVQKVLTTDGNPGTIPITRVWGYWSSTEAGAATAYVINFEFGGMSHFKSKSLTFNYVRAIRSF